MSSEAVTVRPATLADATGLATLSGELGYAASAEQIAARLQAVLANRDHAVFAAENELGEIVGWVHVYRYLVLESDPRAEIGGLVTSSAHRRRGIGRLLIATAESWARTQRLTTIGLRSNIKRADAHAFYATIGYEKTKTQFSFRKSL